MAPSSIAGRPPRRTPRSELAQADFRYRGIPVDAQGHQPRRAIDDFSRKIAATDLHPVYVDRTGAMMAIRRIEIDGRFTSSPIEEMDYVGARSDQLELWSVIAVHVSSGAWRRTN